MKMSAQCFAAVEANQVLGIFKKELKITQKASVCYWTNTLLWSIASDLTPSSRLKKKKKKMIQYNWKRSGEEWQELLQEGWRGTFHKGV